VLGPATEGRARRGSERAHHGEGRCGVVCKLEAPNTDVNGVECTSASFEVAASFGLALIG
jgi:hypothetical protein